MAHRTHRAKIVQDAALALDINLQALPSYSPDFMPVEQHAAQGVSPDRRKTTGKLKACVPLYGNG